MVGWWGLDMSIIEPKHRLSPSGPRLPTEEDHKVLVDETDETPGFLASKVAAGPGIVLAVLPGVNEKVQISAPGSTIDEQVKIRARTAPRDTWERSWSLARTSRSQSCRHLRTRRFK